MQLAKPVLFLFATFLGALPLSVAEGSKARGVNSIPKPSELIRASKEDDRELVRRLIARHADVNATQGDGFSALHWAAYNDDVELVQLLLKARAAPEARTRLEGVTPLMLAAGNGDAASIEALLAAGAKVDTANENGTTPLMQAAAAGTSDALLVLLNHGANINTREKTFGQSALFFAAARDRIGAIRVLTQHGADTTYKTSVQKLERVTVGVNGEELAAGAQKDPGLRGGVAAKAIVSEAKSEGSDNVVKAEPDAKTVTAEAARKTSSPSQEAEHQEHSVKNEKPTPGGKKDTPDAYGFTAEDRRNRVYGSLSIGGLTALHVAARDGQTSAVKALLSAHADINARSETDKATPLLLALINGHYDTAKVLIEHNADVTLTSSDGLSALYAVIDVQWAPHTWYPQPITAQEDTTYLDLLRLMLDRKADPNTALTRKLWFRVFANDETWVDVTGATPFWRAALASDLQVMELLAAHGADTNVATKSADTALMAAAGVGWAAYWTSNAPSARIDAVKFCLEHGADLNKADVKGYTALHGAAFRGDDALITYLLAHGADLGAKTKLGDTVADSANGLFEHAVVHPETVALLERLGSKSSNNCRSNECLVPTKEDKPVNTAKAESTKSESISDTKPAGEKK
ncbi:ankyrin repeat domain-containing protein [Granulicella sp. dw_53]|uniref:ankyrin repeat domain-containing protein n=1 Tax=Granulicella sp. dw_53 TaxID=2719792 RepID=UPI001BD6CA3D|nr:ankyrin repeat domain-containing protein [Granulicella sp. dw_53]